MAYSSMAGFINDLYTFLHSFFATRSRCGTNDKISVLLPAGRIPRIFFSCCLWTTHILQQMRWLGWLIWGIVRVLATTTSKADVYLKECPQAYRQPLFPWEQHPSTWRSCNDAYEYTWMNDFGGHLKGLSLLNRMRLAYSMVSS